MLTIDNVKITPKPDFGRFLKALKRNAKPDRIAVFELHANTVESIAGHLIKKNECKDELEYNLKLETAYQYKLGYDYINARASYTDIRPGLNGGDSLGGSYVNSESNYVFKRASMHEGDTSEGKRTYLQGSDCAIADWEEFGKYPWPDISRVDYSPLERAKKFMPEGMKIIPLPPGGVLANVMQIIGYETMSFMSIEDPKLLRAIFENVGGRLVKLYEGYGSIAAVGALILNDDMGFKTQTLVSPDMLREYVFPWHKKIVEVCHKHGKAAILHACGNVNDVYDDIIACGWDAKHSFEDIIMPVWEFKAKYGKKITPLGGFDMDKISRLSLDEVRKHTRFLINNCGKDGFYAVGTGNSVADYVPAENFLAMVEEAHTYGRL